MCVKYDHVYMLRLTQHLSLDQDIHRLAGNDIRGFFYWHGFTLILVRISNYIYYIAWDKIICQFPNLNGRAVVDWHRWIHPWLYWAYYYLSTLGLKLKFGKGSLGISFGEISESPVIRRWSSDAFSYLSDHFFQSMVTHKAIDWCHNC